MNKMIEIIVVVIPLYRIGFAIKSVKDEANSEISASLIEVTIMLGSNKDNPIVIRPDNKKATEILFTHA